MRKVVFAGNWKMYKTQAETLEFLQEFLPQLDPTPEGREIVLCAPFTDLAVLSKNLHGSRVRVGAQNIHWEDFGAYTGAISGPMLAELGVRYVIVGHSERRQYIREVDQDNTLINLRLKAAQRHGITPILCVGETKEQRDAGEIESRIFSQLETDLPGVDQQNLIVAYEPIWAIGTGETCEASEANRVIGLIRKRLSNPDATIQYGGSVKPENIDEIMAQPEIDGALVGGGSLKGESWARIVNYRPV